MNDEKIAAFSLWYNTGRPYGILRDEINAAIIEFRAKKDSKKE
jgi:hypothetical protein